MDEVAIAWKALTTTWAVPAAVGGVVWGIFGGALPGISPSIAMALLLPFTFGMDPPTAMILLASVYVGAEYGGSIPAIRQSRWSPAVPDDTAQLHQAGDGARQQPGPHAELELPGHQPIAKDHAVGRLRRTRRVLIASGA